MPHDRWYWINLAIVLAFCVAGAIQGLCYMRRQDQINKAIDDRNAPKLGLRGATGEQGMSTQTPPGRLPLVEGLLAKHLAAANALVVGGQLEDTLEKLLLTAGRPVSNKLAERIFTGMGPLHSFAGKIQIAYFFELIEEPLFKDLIVIKDIRNAFAHTTRHMAFSDELIASKCRQLSNWQKGADPEDRFYARSLECLDSLRQHMDRLLMIKALQEPTVLIEDE